ncbi:unnamed protein product [Ectocarpus sp. 12 AP-2014]
MWWCRFRIYLDYSMYAWFDVSLPPFFSRFARNNFIFFVGPLECVKRNSEWNSDFFSVSILLFFGHLSIQTPTRLCVHVTQRRTREVHPVVLGIPKKVYMT